MIRLVVALLACLALHPPARAAHAPERAIGAAVTHHATAAAVDAQLDGVAPALAPRLAPPGFLAFAAASPPSFVATQRLWLRTQHLLC